MEINFDINEWDFYAEGGQHILLRFIGSTNTFQNNLLRLRKVKYILGYDRGLTLEQSYHRVVSEWINKEYLVPSENIFLLSEDVDTLKQKIFPNCLKIEHVHKRTTYIEQSVTVLPNLNILEKQLPVSHLKYLHKSLSFEFKVKCGILTKSSFTSLNKKFSFLKQTFSSYAITQLARAGETLSDSQLIRLQYNPLDLCSQNSERIHESLIKLFDFPFNNFKVSYDGVHIYGCGLDDRRRLQFTLSEFFDVSFLGSDQEFFRSQLFPLLVAILCEEAAFGQLEAMQALDVLGIEGCQIIFDRLCSLQGSVEASLASLRDFSDFALNPNLYSCLRDLKVRAKSHSDQNHNHPFTPSIIEDELLNNILLLFPRTADSEEDLAQLAQQAVLWINTLSVHECKTLLQMWLISLAASDASIIVTLRKVSEQRSSGGAESESGRNVRRLRGENGARVVFSQDEGRAGVCELDVPSDYPHAKHLTLGYSVSVIDIGPKPPEKIVEKCEQDSRRCEFAMRGLELLYNTNNQF